MLGSFPARAQRAPTQQEIQQAQTRWDEGKVAFGRGDFELALLSFKQAYAAYPHPAFLQNLGETELRTGRLVDAARHLALYLRKGVELTDSERALATRSLKKASERLGAIVVSTNTAGAELRVDGEFVGKTPLEDAPWYVEPGKHEITLHKSGHLDAQRVLDVPTGPPVIADVPLRAVLTPGSSSAASSSSVQGPSGAPVSSVVPPAKSAERPALAASPGDSSSSGVGRTLVLASEALVSAAGLAMGIGYLLAANAADDQARSHQVLVDAAPVQPACAAPTGAVQEECQALHNALSDAKRDRDLSTVGFVSAGAGLAVLVATVILWKPSSVSRPAFRMDASPGRASATLVWRY